MMILAVFRSRSHSLDYVQRLHSYGVQATTVPTPKEARIGCGLCVRFEAQYFARAQAVLKLGGYASFKGFYKTDFINGRMTLAPYVHRK